ncbi:SIS domain-containing protein, partial [Lichenihabitans sp. Uapishka_5]|uniref:SIS domain-containing protein n=1 Tax=Lichenihabitans sp. Uapishka_5 TaxID=3037302 RepID=UPI0029E7D8E2
PDALVITLSSSGTTTRTVEAALIARARGARTLALSNTLGSALMVESDRGLPVLAERKGWPTQASTAALAMLLQFGLDLAATMGRHPERVERLQAELDAMPDRMVALTEACEGTVADPAHRAASRSIFLFAGGGPSFATALFGAAKVKECSPDHAIAIPLEEFHH